jgi:two-component system, chemotaxis family, chemotaxis protein CheY
MGIRRMAKKYDDLCVLIVGDNKVARTRLRVLLRELGIRDVAWAVNGDVALRTLADEKRHYPNLIIADMRMGPMDGLQFCQAVRRDRNIGNADVPIMVFTADSETDSEASSKGIDDVDLVGKQVSLNVLERWVSRHVP